MGLLTSLFGGKPAQGNPDPHPGIGGYTYPPGPEGKTGYPGSTSQTLTNPRAARKNYHRGTPYVPIEAQQRARQDTAGEQYGGLPMQGTLASDGVGPQYQDTEHRSQPTISANIPGGLNQRNTRYYGGILARPTPETRYVWGGTNGGQESYSMDRRIPYTGHGTDPSMGIAKGSVRGAVLDGTRFNSAPPVLRNQGGAIGSRKLHQRNRSTVFKEPPPWNAHVYVTDAATGGPGSAATPQGPVDVVVSPRTSRRRNVRRGAGHGRL